MGYSLFVKFKDSKEHQRMNDFYNSNSDIIKDLSFAEGRKDTANYIQLHSNERISSSPKNILGFEGPSGRPYYLELLLVWMAVKSSYRDKTNEPFFYYDGKKNYINNINESFLIRVNEKGIQTIENFLVPKKKKRHLSLSLDIDDNMQTNKSLEEYAQKVEDLFNILEHRWQKFQLINKVSKNNKP